MEVLEGLVRNHCVGVDGSDFLSMSCHILDSFFVIQLTQHITFPLTPWTIAQTSHSIFYIPSLVSQLSVLFSCFLWPVDHMT